MGKLRKIGRQIQKKLNKVFGSKIGNIVGMIGMYFAMGAVAKQLSGWWNSTFGKAGQAAAESTAQVGVEASTLAEEKMSESLTADITAKTETLLGDTAAKTTTGPSVDSMIANATNNADAANSAMAAYDSKVLSSTELGSLNNNITDEVVNFANDSTALSQSVNNVKNNLAGTQTFNAGEYFASQSGAGTAGQFSPVSVDPGVEGAFTRAAIDIPQKPGFFKRQMQNIYAGLTGDEFIPGVAQGVTSSLIMSEIQGEPESPFVGRGVQPQPSMEMAQGQYLQDISPQFMAATGSNRSPSFQDLTQNVLYGSGSPQYLSQFYQPLGIA